MIQPSVSGCARPGIAGICEICSEPYPDASQFDSTSPYFDPKSSVERPRWWLRKVRLINKTPLLPLAELRTFPELAAMPLLARGNRLSILPVRPEEWRFITEQLLK